jgi:hypothetical protein
MTDAVNEQLSACLDGELPAAELDLLLKRLERNPELREALGRYTAIGEALREARPVVASRSFADKVLAAVDQEPAAARRRVRISPVLLRGLRPVAGIGVAATVAAVAIFAVQRAGVAPGPVVADQPAAAPTSIVACGRAHVDRRAERRRGRELHRADARHDFAVGLRAGDAPHELRGGTQRILFAAGPPLGPDRRAGGRRQRPRRRDQGRRDSVSIRAIAAVTVAVSIRPRWPS